MQTDLEGKRKGQRLLIQLVQNRPVLWKKNHPTYRDKAARDEAWGEIASIMDNSYEKKDEGQQFKSAQLMAKKWCNIRDTYVKTLKHSKSPYIFSEDLDFLGLAEKYKNKKRKFDETNESEEEDYFYNEETPQVETEFAEINISTDEFLSPRKSEILDAVRNTASEDVVNVLANLIEKEEDEDRAFFKSIMSSVKSLPDSAKFEFRMEVMKLIDNLKAKFDVNKKRKVKNEKPDE